MISETWNPLDMNTHITNYKPIFIKTRKNRLGGGVAIHIQNNIKVANPHQHPIISNLEFTTFENF